MSENEKEVKSKKDELIQKKRRLRAQKKKRAQRKLRRVLILSFGILIVIIALQLFLNPSEVGDAQQDDENSQSLSQNLQDETLPLSGKVVVLDAGHDQYTNEYEGYIEGVAMLSLAQQIKPLLENLGAQVHLTRSDGDFVELAARASITNTLSLEKLKEIKLMQGVSESDEEIKEIDYLISIMQLITYDSDEYASLYMNTPFDEEEKITDEMQRIFELQSDETLQDNFLFISLHSDGLDQEYYDYVGGADVYYISNDMYEFGDYYTNYANIDNVLDFADILLDDIDAIGMQRSDIMQGNLLVVRQTNIPAVLVENGYHTNDADRKKLEDPNFITDLAFAYETAILEYFTTR